MFRSAASRLFLLLCCLVLAGCGGRELQTRVVSLGAQQAWEADAEASARQPLELKRAESGAAYLRYEVVRRPLEREWQFDATQKQDRMVTSPDALSVVVGAATLGLHCAIDTEGCFGDRSAWRIADKVERANARPTGNTRVGAPQPYRDRVTFLVTLRGFDAQGQALGVVRVRHVTQGHMTVGVAGLTEQLPSRPQRVEVRIELAPGVPAGLALAPVAVQTYEAKDIAGWQVYVPQWQAPQVQHKAWANVLRAQVLAGRLDDAARTRARLAELQWRPLPELELGYATALADARRAAEAREVLQALLRSADASADTQARARRLLASL